ncbi:MAG: hypothetical protein WA802_16060 [Terracidiphilus sp.]
MRLIVTLIALGLCLNCRAQSTPLVDAPIPHIGLPALSADKSDLTEESSSADIPDLSASIAVPERATQPAQRNDHKSSSPQANSKVPVDANGDPIPLERQQPTRILGFMPNFRSVSGGSKPHPPGWKYNFVVATHQATDYSTFIFLGLTSLTAEGMNMHPSLGKGVNGFYAYTWRGFLDKSDGTYLSAWLLPSLIHEDTRFYALGAGHSIPVRALYVISRQAVARTYGGRQTPNIAGLGGKVLTQVVSRTYYPPSATSFPVLATKFSYSVMRDVMFSAIREFYPDAAAHFIRKHREKMARLSAREDAAVY